MVLINHFQLILALLVVFSLQCFAHTTQTAPPVVEITPHSMFFGVSVSGDLSDLLEAVHPGTHDLDASQSLTVMPDNKAFGYLLDAIELQQGQPLKGSPVRIIRFDDPTWSSGHGFIATFRYDRPVESQKQELQFSSRIFDYLERSRTVIALGEQRQSVPMGGMVKFKATDTLPDGQQNVREWFWDGVHHATFGIEHQLFLLALLVCGTHFSFLFRWKALALWILLHGFTFGLSALGILLLLPQFVSVGTALTLVGIGAVGYAIARGTMNPKLQRVSEFALLGLIGIAGLIHGLALVPVDRQLFPDVSFGFSVLSFFLGTALSEIGLFILFGLLFPRIKGYYDARERYGGMGWLCAARTASGSIGAIGLFFVLQRCLEVSS